MKTESLQMPITLTRRYGRLVHNSSEGLWIRQPCHPITY